MPVPVPDTTGVMYNEGNAVIARKCKPKTLLLLCNKEKRSIKEINIRYIPSGPRNLRL